MKFKLISCEVLYREMCAAVARSPHQIDVEFLPKGLHDLGGAPMCERLQQAVDRVEPGSYDAILLGYGLCGNGTVGLCARSLHVVIPRTHDCIALLMGSRDRYQNYFDQNQGVYFRSTGWLERGVDLNQETIGIVHNKTGYGHTLKELIERYGEENGQYLFDQLNAYQHAYRKLTYISTGLEPNESFEQNSRDEAAAKGWEFEHVDGSLRLFERLVAGDWNQDDFLIVPPGWRITPTYDTEIIDKEPQ